MPTTHGLSEAQTILPDFLSQYTEKASSVQWELAGDGVAIL
jgi:hypothetical protein